MTLLKLRHNQDWWNKMAECEMPFDHYFLQGSGEDRHPIRPGHADLYISILNEVREICRGKKEHEFVRFRDLKFTKIEK